MTAIAFYCGFKANRYFARFSRIYWLLIMRISPPASLKALIRAYLVAHSGMRISDEIGID